MRTEKPFMTYDQQVDKLQDKGLVVSDRNKIIELLKECSYFGLITGYKKPFKDTTGRYKLHTTIEDIYALYEYDMFLRELYLRYILIIENHIKSLISYSFCSRFGENQSEYLNVNNYDYTAQKQQDINGLVQRLNEVIAKSDDHKYLKHQKDKYGNIPLWALTRVLTLGNISKMYSLLTPSVQSNISKEFVGVNEAMLSRMIDMLSRVRNVCAHNERLYDYQYNKGSISNMPVHKALKLKSVKGNYVIGKKDLFAVVIIFRYCLKQSDFIVFIDKMDGLIDNLLDSTNVIQRTQILKLMGFPINWKDIREYR